MVKLDSRLGAVVKMIEDVENVYDIGADHAYTSIYLLKNNIIRKAVISDVNIGPLDSAKKNAEKYDVLSKSEFILSNGFERINITSGAGIIAGMGGELIINILNQAKNLDKTKKLDYIIIQPMNATEKLRQYLYDNGFVIVKEDIIKDRDFFYNILKIKNRGENSKEYKNNEILYLEIGYNLFKNKHKLFSEYVSYKLNIEEKILKMCENNDTLKAKTKAKITSERIYIIKEIIRSYEGQ